MAGQQLTQLHYPSTSALRAKGLTEQRLRTSGMAWTALQPNAYMDTWIPMVVGGPALTGQPITLVGDRLRRHSMIARRDVASYATAVLDRAEAHSRCLPIGCPVRSGRRSAR